MFPREKIDEVRDRTDLVALISGYVPLKKRGTRWVGLCPFHQEKTPSFGVTEGRNFFICFGCQEKGTAIDFLMKMEGLNFPQALEQLAERAGVELPRVNDREQEAIRRARQRKEMLANVMNVATEFFEQQLQTEGSAERARAELTRRGVSEETRATFRLGYAPDSWDSLAKHLESKGVRTRDAVEVGLISQRRSGTGHYDFFRDRLMFPVTDLKGWVVAFSGLRMKPPEEEPRKYINSTDSPLFHKGRNLYGLYEGRIAARREKRLLLCEGNFDLLAIHQAGFPNVVAALGTAFTREHGQLMRRFGEHATVVFDGDRAGRAATRKAYEVLQQVGVQGWVSALPEGLDPDDFIRDRGEEAFRALIQRAQPMVEYLIDAAAEDTADLETRVRAIRELAPVLANVDSPLQRDVYVERIARRFGVSDPTSVRQELRRGFREARQAQRSKRAPARRPEPRPQASANSAPPAAAMASGPSGASNDAEKQVGSSAEINDTSAPENPPAPVRRAADIPELQRRILGALLDFPKVFEAPEAKKLDELLTDGDLRAIFRDTARMVEQCGEVDAPELLQKCASNPARGWLGERLSVTEVPNIEAAQAALVDGLPRLEQGLMQHRRAKLSTDIRRAQQQGDEQRVQELMRERDELLRAQYKQSPRGENGG